MHNIAINVQNRVLSVVRSVLQQNAITADVHPESRLVDIGLSSMGMVELMLKVEVRVYLLQWRRHGIFRDDTREFAWPLARKHTRDRRS